MKTNNRSLRITSLLSVLLPAAVALVIANVRAQESSSPSAGTSATKSATAAQKVDSDISGISLELTSVQKTGDTIMVRFKYISARDKPTRIDDETKQDVGDMYYVDAKNKKKYPIIKDTEGKPLSSNLKYFEVGAGETKAGWAKFPAPPPDVTAISVYIPGAPPFENVPIAL